MRLANARRANVKILEPSNNEVVNCDHFRSKCSSFIPFIDSFTPSFMAKKNLKHSDRKAGLVLLGTRTK